MKHRLTCYAVNTISAWLFKRKFRLWDIVYKQVCRKLQVVSSKLKQIPVDFRDAILRHIQMIHSKVLSCFWTCLFRWKQHQLSKIHPVEQRLTQPKDHEIKVETVFFLLLMEEILHQLIGSFSHYLQGFINSRRCRISSINSHKYAIPQSLKVGHWQSGG